MDAHDQARIAQKETSILDVVEISGRPPVDTTLDVHASTKFM